MTDINIREKECTKLSIKAETGMPNSIANGWWVGGGGRLFD